MPPNSEQVYNHLNGEEANQIMLARIQALFGHVKEFNRTTTLDRVRMEVNIRFEVSGRTPPAFRITDDFTIRMPEPETVGTLIDEEIELSDMVSAHPDDEHGQPPDEIREEHGLPIMTPMRGPMGIEDVPVVRNGVKYAAFITQDMGSASRGERNEDASPVAQFAQKKGLGKPEVPLQQDFKDFAKGR